MTPSDRTGAPRRFFMAELVDVRGDEHPRERALLKAEEGLAPAILRRSATSADGYDCVEIFERVDDAHASPCAYRYVETVVLDETTVGPDDQNLDPARVVKAVLVSPTGQRRAVAVRLEDGSPPATLQEGPDGEYVLTNRVASHPEYRWLPLGGRG